VTFCSHEQLLEHALQGVILNAIKRVGFPDHWTLIDFLDEMAFENA